MPVDASPVGIAALFALAVLLISILLVLARLLKGPAAADRIVALDLISILIVAFLAVYSVYSGEISFLDVAIGYALVAFLGTVALARFLMRLAIKRSNLNRENDSGET
ncbi:MAG: cation:proton antiporter [Deltaproteobacteria bacterium]|jgi:multicomponent Na+:H+ antiporter subunit F|nr:cation:proton antiporter [Deltaproteobacteria bacterium]